MIWFRDHYNPLRSVAQRIDGMLEKIMLAQAFLKAFPTTQILKKEVCFFNL